MEKAQKTALFYLKYIDSQWFTNIFFGLALEINILLFTSDTRS